MFPTQTNNTKDLVNQLLDKGYVQQAGKVVDAITKSVSEGVIAQRLAELDAEAQRLAELGQKLQADNPVLRALRADLATVLDENASAIDAVAPKITASANSVAEILTKRLAFGDATDDMLAEAGIQWNVANPDAVASLIGYSSRPEWDTLIDQYKLDSVQAVQDIAIRGIANGWGPLRAAREIAALSESIPVYQANTMMRTLQLQSYRDATALQQAANADIISEVVRIATLDDRTCLACIALHGTRIAVGSRVNDHHNGRCTSITVVRGMEREILSGVAWFDNLPDARKKEIAGDANFMALKADKVKLIDFVSPYDDALWGQMVQEASLKKILGAEAKQYYPVPTFGRDKPHP